MDRKERIKYLQMMNRRRLMLGEMQKHINEIVLDDFLSLDKTKELQTEVYKIMDQLESTKSSVIKPLDTNYVDWYIDNIHIFSNYRDEKIVFFHQQSMDIGAVEIQINVILNNINYVVSASEMAENGCRIILVSKDLKFGLCLWKSEYDFQLYKWEDLGKC